MFDGKKEKFDTTMCTIGVLCCQISPSSMYGCHSQAIIISKFMHSKNAIKPWCNSKKISGFCIGEKVWFMFSLSLYHVLVPPYSIKFQTAHFQITSSHIYYTILNKMWTLWCLVLPYQYSCPVPDWASECPDVKNYKWRLNPVWHRILYSCTHMAIVGVKGLMLW